MIRQKICVLIFPENLPRNPPHGTFFWHLKQNFGKIYGKYAENMRKYAGFYKILKCAENMRKYAEICGAHIPPPCCARFQQLGAWGWGWELVVNGAFSG